MRRISLMFGGALVMSFAMSATAFAQETRESYLQQRVRAPSHALELKVGTGYTQGFGTIAPGRGIDNVAGAGLGVGAEIDYRLSRPWSLGVEGQFQEFNNAQNSWARGLAANIGGTYHFEPVLRGDPWVRLGTGYRLLWESDPSGLPRVVVLRHGFDLVTAKVGYDVRVSEDVALGPVLGADLDMFVWEAPSNAPYTAMSNPQVGTFIYAGLQGRFDIGGTRDGAAEPVAKRQPAPESKGVTAPQPQTPIAPPPPPMEPASPAIAVSEEVMKACKLNLGAVEKAPKFAFDKSDLQAADFAVLDQIGDCFTTGPLKDVKMQLVGRADPRGSHAYNDALGMRRAKEVAAYLERFGLDTSRMDVTSRGKRDALGRDAATWAIDRRVDIVEAP